MTTPVWQPGTLYPPGSLVQPVTAPPYVATVIANAGFESGDVSWNKDAGWTIGTFGAGTAFTGTRSAQFNLTGTGNINSVTTGIVTPGQSVTASCMVQQGASSAGQAGARVVIVWTTAADVYISQTDGNMVDNASGGAWLQSTATGIAPAGAGKCYVRAYGFRNSGSSPLWVDNFTWNHTGPAVATGLVYRAVQATTGSSGATEPVWPLTLLATVVDNQVTWQAVQATRVTWEAEPILKSGSPEPVWPVQPGASIADGTIRWTAVSRRVEDENCPNSTVVAILASKVFASDGDIVRFSATSNPLNWTAQKDAGFLPTGLQQANSNNMAVLAPYRANLAAFNASSFQNWQVDPDPTAMAILDQMDGIGSTYHKAAVAVGDELLFLSALGVRSVGMSGANESLSSGDVGMPVDPLVQQAMAASDLAGVEPIATYYPALGQYWLAFPDFPPPPILISIYNLLSGVLVGLPVTHSYEVGGGVGPFTFSIILGSLPTGLSMSPSGFISGTPTTAGDFAWRVQVVDSLGNMATVDQGVNVPLGIDGPPFEVTYAGKWIAGGLYQSAQGVGNPDYLAVSDTVDGLATAPRVLKPAGISAVLRVSAANGKMFLHGTPTSYVSSDFGASWTPITGGTLNTAIEVFWNGTAYYNNLLTSTDGIAWSSIANLPSGAVRVVYTREDNGLVLLRAVFGGNNILHRSYDDGANWTSVYTSSSSLNDSFAGTGDAIWHVVSVTIRSTQDDFTSVFNPTGPGTPQTFEAGGGVAIGRAVTNRLVRYLPGGMVGVEMFSGYPLGANVDTNLVFGVTDWLFCSPSVAGPTTMITSQDGGQTWAPNGLELFANGAARVAFARIAP